jgi:hypothetical protein
VVALQPQVLEPAPGKAKETCVKGCRTYAYHGSSGLVSGIIAGVVVGIAVTVGSAIILWVIGLERGDRAAAAPKAAPVPEAQLLIASQKEQLRQADEHMVEVKARALAAEKQVQALQDGLAEELRKSSRALAEARSKRDDLERQVRLLERNEAAERLARQSAEGQITLLRQGVAAEHKARQAAEVLPGVLKERIAALEVRLAARGQTPAPPAQDTPADSPPATKYYIGVTKDGGEPIPRR